MRLKPNCQTIPVILLTCYKFHSPLLLAEFSCKVLLESKYKYLRQSNKVALYLTTIILRCLPHTNPNTLLLAKRFQPHFYLEKFEQTFFSKKLTLASGACILGFFSELIYFPRYITLHFNQSTKFPLNKITSCNKRIHAVIILAVCT